MTGTIKSGHEILDDFFLKLDAIEGVDHDVASILTNLHKEGKLTNTHISNNLLKVREAKLRGKD